MSSETFGNFRPIDHNKWELPEKKEPSEVIRFKDLNNKAQHIAYELGEWVMNMPINPKNKRGKRKTSPFVQDIEFAATSLVTLTRTIQKYLIGHEDVGGTPNFYRAQHILETGFMDRIHQIIRLGHFHLYFDVEKTFLGDQWLNHFINLEKSIEELIDRRFNHIRVSMLYNDFAAALLHTTKKYPFKVVDELVQFINQRKFGKALNRSRKIERFLATLPNYSADPKYDHLKITFEALHQTLMYIHKGIAYPPPEISLEILPLPQNKKRVVNT